MHQSLSESASFCKRWYKYILVFFHSQNTNAKLHKVVLKHYSGEVENVYTSVPQIYSGQYGANFIGIGRVL